MTIPDLLERALALSRADDCIVIALASSQANVRWANNTTTTNGVIDSAAFAIASVVGGRVGSVGLNHLPNPDDLEDLVRASEAACEGKPEAPDRMPLVEGSGLPAGWGDDPLRTDVGVFSAFAPALANVFERARSDDVLTFGYAEHSATTTWLATSSGVRKRHEDARGKVEITGKSPDFARSTWAGAATRTFADVDPAALYAKIMQRLAWSERKIETPAGHYEVLLEPSCSADMALGVYASAAARDADEGRSVFSRPGGGNRIGERMFGSASLYSDPGEPGFETVPFVLPLAWTHSGISIGSSAWESLFDAGLDVARADWVRDGVLSALVTPRSWAQKSGASAAVPAVDNIVVSGDGATLDDMIARTERALLVTCLWYIRMVDPQTALETGLTRDGVFVVENGEVVGVTNNFRWNMSPVATFAQATEIGRTGPALPREWDEFLLAKAPPMRVEGFNMSSVSDAT